MGNVLLLFCLKKHFYIFYFLAYFVYKYKKLEATLVAKIELSRSKTYDADKNIVRECLKTPACHLSLKTSFLNTETSLIRKLLFAVVAAKYLLVSSFEKALNRLNYRYIITIMIKIIIIIIIIIIVIIITIVIVIIIVKNISSYKGIEYLEKLRPLISIRRIFSLIYICLQGS